MAWLGVENVRIPGPVFIGDTIQTKGTVLKKRESRKPDRGLITMAYEIFKQNEEIVMAYEPVFLVRRKT